MQSVEEARICFSLLIAAVYIIVFVIRLLVQVRLFHSVSLMVVIRSCRSAYILFIHLETTATLRFDFVQILVRIIISLSGSLFQTATSVLSCYLSWRLVSHAAYFLITDEVVLRRVQNAWGFLLALSLALFVLLFSSALVAADSVVFVVIVIGRSKEVLWAWAVVVHAIGFLLLLDGVFVFITVVAVLVF